MKAQRYEFPFQDDLLLLKKGGYTVFYGPLGENCSNLVEYFESRGAEPINKGENPANWMLKVITAEVADTDYAAEFQASKGRERMMEKIASFKESPDPEAEIKYESQFATSWKTRLFLMNDRMKTIYWRSPAYNLSRVLIAMVIALIMGSVFLNNRKPSSFTENEMSGYLSVIFLSFIIIGVLAITSVLPVMLKIRDAFYRHEAAGMLNASSVTLALGVVSQTFVDSIQQELLRRSSHVLLYSFVM